MARKKYTSRSDFLARLQVVAKALRQHVDPAQVDRLGIRYVDRIEGSAVDQLPDLVRAEVRGITGTPAATHATHAVSECVFTLPTGTLLARWGLLPPGFTVDPAAMEPVDAPSWILDLDMFSVTPSPFDVEQIVATTKAYAERGYTVFRWAVTEQFLARYGGKS